MRSNRIVAESSRRPFVACCRRCRSGKISRARTHSVCEVITTVFSRLPTSPARAKKQAKTSLASPSSKQTAKKALQQFASSRRSRERMRELLSLSHTYAHFILLSFIQSILSSFACAVKCAKGEATRLPFHIH